MKSTETTTTETTETTALPEGVRTAKHRILCWIDDDERLHLRADSDPNDVAGRLCLVISVLRHCLNAGEPIFREVKEKAGISFLGDRTLRLMGELREELERELPPDEEPDENENNE